MLSEHDIQGTKDLLMNLLQALARHPQDVKIETEAENRLIRFTVRCNPADLGAIIGKGGNRVNAIRNIMKAKATQVGCRVLVDIRD